MSKVCFPLTRITNIAPPLEVAGAHIVFSLLIIAPGLTDAKIMSYITAGNTGELF